MKWLKITKGEKNVPKEIIYFGMKIQKITNNKEKKRLRARTRYWKNKDKNERQT